MYDFIRVFNAFKRAAKIAGLVGLVQPALFKSLKVLSENWTKTGDDRVPRRWLLNFYHERIPLRSDFVVSISDSDQHKIVLQIIRCEITSQNVRKSVTEMSSSGNHTVTLTS